MNSTEKLDNLIKAEKEKISKLEAKQEAIEANLKKSKANLEKYILMRNNKSFNELSNALDEKGIGIEDIMGALAAGDFSALQSRLSEK